MEIVITQTNYDQYGDDENPLEEAVTHEDENLKEALDTYLEGQNDMEVYDKDWNCAVTSDGVISAYYSEQLQKVNEDEQND